MARKITPTARMADLTDRLLNGGTLADEERLELRDLTTAAKAEAEMPTAVHALERAQAKAAAAQAEIDRLQALIDGPTRKGRV